MNGKKLNDGEFHHVKIHKTKNSVTVLLMEWNILNIPLILLIHITMTYVGLGLWDGDLEVRNLFVES